MIDTRNMSRSRRPTADPKSRDIERIKLELLGEYEREGLVDIAQWTRRFPEHREELIAYWMWLRGTPRLADIDLAQSVATHDDIAEHALNQACMAVSLGRQWLEAAVDADGDAEGKLGLEMERLRLKSFGQTGTAPKAFRRAVVYSWVVSVLGERSVRVSRLATQKATYFLERGLSLGLFTEHQRKPLGPYDHQARYKDAEPIASKKGWLRVSGSTFEAGEQSSELSRYVGRYVRSEDLARRLLAVLARVSDSELETWATVDWAGRVLSAQGHAIAAVDVRRIFSQTPEWHGKLRRQNFREAAIARAIDRLSRLRLLTPVQESKGPPS